MISVLHAAHPPLPRLMDTSQGGMLCLWAARAIHRGTADCHALAAAYDRQLGADGPAALANLTLLMRLLAHKGRRPLRFALAGHGGTRPQPDEITFLAALEAAGRGHSGQCQAHLTWLLARPADAALGVLASEVAAIFHAAGLTLLLDAFPPAA